MITVLPSDNREYIESAFKKAGLASTDKSGCVTAKFGDEILGECLYELDEKGIVIKKLYPESDIMLADGILRSALHVAAQRSAMDARYESTVSEELLRKLGFIKSREEKTLDIDLLFGGCGCKK